MSILNNSLLLGAPAAAAAGARSIRLNAADSAYLSRTPSQAGNQRTWTLAMWIKMNGVVNSIQRIFQARESITGNQFFLQIRTDYKLWISGTGGAYELITDQVFRDPSAWGHLVLSVDTTQATAANRIRLYWNGAAISAPGTQPSLNSQLTVNATWPHSFGIDTGTSSEAFNGYLADIHFIDGQALTPTSFGEPDATTGVWVPKAYTGSYGTNGFRLDFSDNSAATAAAIGADRSGNGNNFTPTNLSVTAGAGNDSLVDVPTNGSQTDTGAGGEVRGNYCTLNPLSPTLSKTLANGNLDVTLAALTSARGTIGVASGKWYWEVTYVSRVSGSGTPNMGVCFASNLKETPQADSTDAYTYYGGTGQKQTNGTLSSYGNTYTTSDVVGFALDLDNGRIWFSKNGTWQASGDPAAGTNAAFTGLSGTYVPLIAADGNGTYSLTANFGQRSWAYAAPSGFKALNSASLPAPTIVKPDTVMDVVLWSGNNSSTRSFSSLGFNPDLVWTKIRNDNFNHIIFDAVRGAGGNKELSSSSTGAEGAQSTSLYGFISSFDANGFTVAAGSDAAPQNLGWVNFSGRTYAGWCWDAGSSNATNTAGTLTSTVRANASAGFSVVTYTGNNTNGATVGHGLGVAPALIIIKRRDVADDWLVYHSARGATRHLLLNSTAAEATGSNRWNSTAPTSTVFTLGSHNSVNGNGNYVAYCWASVSSYSAFGTYTGNGSSDGPFVYTGHRSRFLLIKCSSLGGSGQNWIVIDTTRDTYNVSENILRPNLSDAEIDYGFVDVLSNGFRLKNTDNAVNGSGQTYIYMALAESPFNYARAR